jgi:6-phosphogluconolactonase
MYQLNEFNNREQFDQTLAKQVADLLSSAIAKNGKASLAVSGGSTPKGFFCALSQHTLPWQKVTITLADERWVGIEDAASNTALVHQHLLQNNAAKAKFFHIKQGDELCQETLTDLDLAAKSTFLPLDVVILGMGEDGHTASLFPCSDEISQGLDVDNQHTFIKVKPKTAPHQRITFSFRALSEAKNTFLQIAGSGKKQVLEQAIAGTDKFEMPIRAFLQHPHINTQVFWAE